METTRRDAFAMLAGAGLGVAGAVQAAPGSGSSGSTSQAGWRPLFNGRDLSGWTFFQDGVGDRDTHGAVEIRDGALHILGPAYRPGPSPFGYVATTEAFGDYHLSLEYRWGERRYHPRANWKRDSGILYHTRSGRDFLWPDCIEFQIMERNTGDALPVNHRAIPAVSLGGLPSWPANFPGADAYAPQVDAGGTLRQWIKADGDFETLDGWNTVELIASGQNAAQLVNGRIVTALYGLEAQDPHDRTRHVPLSRGRILLQIEAAEIVFRNIRIRPLPPGGVA